MSMNHLEIAEQNGTEYVVEKGFVRDPFSRLRFQAINNEDSMTLQSEAEQCDINVIISRYARDGILPPPRMEGAYGDVSSLNRPLSELLDESRATIQELNRALSQPKQSADGQGSQDNSTTVQPSSAET